MTGGDSGLRLADFIDWEPWLGDHIVAIGQDCNRPHLHSSIRRACLNKRAFLFVAPKGFVVLKPRAKDGLKSILVWVAYSKSGTAISDYSDDIENLARETGSSHLDFYTVRRGFDRLAPKLGWSKKHVEGDFSVWRKPL
jgi:hypothetical protein